MRRGPAPEAGTRNLVRDVGVGVRARVEEWAGAVARVT